MDLELLEGAVAIGETVILLTLPLLSYIGTPTKGRGGCSRMTVLPTAAGAGALRPLALAFRPSYKRLQRSSVVVGSGHDHDWCGRGLGLGAARIWRASARNLKKTYCGRKGIIVLAQLHAVFMLDTVRRIP